MTNHYQIQELACPADTLALFARLRQLEGSFVLYSGQGFAHEQFDVLSALPVEHLLLKAGSSETELMATTRTMIARLQVDRCPTADLPLPGWYGLAAYDLGQATATPAESHLPLVDTGYYPVIFVVDRRKLAVFCVWLMGHEPQARHLISRIESDTQPISHPFSLLTPFRANMDWPGYQQRFSRVHEYLHAGDCYQVNLAQRFTASFTGDAWIAYRQLAHALPAPMGCFFEGGNYQLLSLSPEKFLSIQNGQVSTRPIKGTRPRLSHPEADRQQAEALRHSEKDQAENLMIVDLLRNDLGISCLPGSIEVTQLFAIESYANVHHMVSHIEGKLKPDWHPLQAFLAAFPGGSITGAPKKRAMEIIAELEPDSRQFYCGSAFYCDVSGRLDSSILIRSLVCESGQMHCWGGGGIVADSTAEAEYQETLDKVGLILRTLEALSSQPET